MSTKQTANWSESIQGVDCSFALNLLNPDTQVMTGHILVSVVDNEGTPEEATRTGNLSITYRGGQFSGSVNGQLTMLELADEDAAIREYMSANFDRIVTLLTGI